MITFLKSDLRGQLKYVEKSIISKIVMKRLLSGCCSQQGDILCTFPTLTQMQIFHPNPRHGFLSSFLLSGRLDLFMVLEYDKLPKTLLKDWESARGRREVWILLDGTGI